MLSLSCSTSTAYSALVLGSIGTDRSFGNGEQIEAGAFIRLLVLSVLGGAKSAKEEGGQRGCLGVTLELLGGQRRINQILS